MVDEIRFEWDPRKALANKRKHGVSFETAAQVFDDPFVYEYEEGTEHGEIRFRAVGEVIGRVFFVSYTSYKEGEEEIVRIISARSASPREIRAYQRHSQNDR
jgi:uncharacterized DUF497 family protein